ncbi:MAG: class I SAM-dependent methyltransferase [Planctomycetota bacterium]
MPLLGDHTPPPAHPSPTVQNETLRHFPHLKGQHPTSWNWPAYLNPDANSWMRSLKSLYDMPITFPASLSPEAGLMLHGLIRNLQPRTVLEIGSFLSVSTHWMTAAMQENGLRPTPVGRVHCFDDFGPIHKGPFRDAEMLTGRLEFVTERLTEAGLIDYIRLHPGDSSTNVLASHDDLRAAGGVDFAFIDGDHGEVGVTADFRAVEPVLNTGGYAMLHDTFPTQCGYDGPRKLIDKIDQVAQGRWEKVELYLSPMNYGMCLLRRIG